MPRLAGLVARSRADFGKTDIFLTGGGKCSIFVPMTAPTSNPETSSAAPARRGGSSGIRRATQLEKVRRDERIVGLLNRGASVPEIAASEGLTLKRMRNVVREILAERMPQPPAEFLALQVSRLNEALLVSFTAMHNAEDGYEFRGRRSCRQNCPRARSLSRIRRCPAVARGNGGASAPASCRASARARRPRPE